MTARRLKVGLTVSALLCCSGQVAAKVTNFEIISVEPAFGGRTFGDMGEYEIVRGKAYFAIDPSNASNKRIAGIDLAPRAKNGTVELDSDIVMLRPKDPKKANGRIFYEPVNRGGALLLGMVSGGARGKPGDLRSPDAASDGFLLSRGYTIVQAGWQASYPVSEASSVSVGLASRLPKSDGFTTLSARVPIAKSKDGKSVTTLDREQFFELGGQDKVVGYLTYPAHAPAAGTLFVREHEDDPRREVPTSSWRFTDKWRISIDRAAIGAGPSAIFELVYQSEDPIVYGLALASMRDFVSWLRYEKAGQTTTRIPAPRLLAFGASQTGRTVKELIYEFPSDERGRRLFDGAAILISGSGRNAINSEFARPGIRVAQHAYTDLRGDDFPFTYENTLDALQANKAGGILDRCRAEKTCPKIIHLDSEMEIWQGGYTAFTTTSGKNVEPPAEVRQFVVSGAEHGPRQRTDLAAPTCSIKASARLDWRPVTRALMIALDDWSTRGKSPPKSVFPHIQNATLVSLDQAKQSFPRIPGVEFPPSISMRYLSDLKSQPPKRFARYPVFGPAYDRDGNMLGGVRLPLVEVPLATQTGWNLRNAQSGGPDLCPSGMSSDFSATTEARQAHSDPRPSLQERYKDEADFVGKIKRSADKLVSEGLLLAEDVPDILSDATARYQTNTAAER